MYLAKGYSSPDGAYLRVSMCQVWGGEVTLRANAKRWW